MTQLGFVIDHSQCIGCHACTIACKSENEVPLGSFRTWVKYTEEGQFPDVRRSFGVLRCNQCTDAPCVSICPSSALEKMANGIVDINHDSCIGCKSCMQACPYDSIYINDASGTAEKCHFCNHRTEIGLAPACAVVCPTEAIVPGDFDDPMSRVSQLKAAGDLAVRKPEAGTSPNVYYRQATPAAIIPTESNAASGYIWSNNTDGLRLEAQQALARDPSIEQKARTVYDVPRKPLWDWKVSAYLTTKALSAGCFLGALPLYAQFLLGLDGGHSNTVGSLLALSLFFLVATLALLVADLKRPARFAYVLSRANWSSWLSRGALAINAFGGLLVIWAWLWYRVSQQSADITNIINRPLATALLALTIAAAGSLAAYTAWLFHQCKGRPLWLRKGLALSLALHAFLAGCALVLVADWALAETCFILDSTTLTYARHGLIGALLLKFVLMLFEHQLAPAGREQEYHNAHRLIATGPFAARHWVISVGVGVVLPLAALLSTMNPVALGVAGILALVGLANEEDVFVKAGQALPIS